MSRKTHGGERRWRHSAMSGRAAVDFATSRGGWFGSGHSKKVAGDPATSAASALQASRFRGDVTVFRPNASAAGQIGSERGFRRNTAERVYPTEAAHNPEVACSSPAPATRRPPVTGPFAHQASHA